MTKSSTSAVGAVLLLGVSALSVVSALDAPSLVSRYGLSIVECDALLTSEISLDFGYPLSDDEAADLWNAAAAWSWTVGAADMGRHHPFIVCEMTPNKSGFGRKKILREMLGISIADGDIDTVYTDFEEMGCFLISADPNDLGTALEGLASTGDGVLLKVQPMGPGFKMLAGSVGAVESWISRANAGLPAAELPSVAVMSSGQANPPVTAYAYSSSSTAYGDSSLLRLDLSLCPGAETAPLEELAADIVSFLADNDGKAVAESSFFAHDGAAGTVSSDRLNFWSSHIRDTLSASDGDARVCLSALRQEMVIDGSDFELGSVRVLLPTQDRVIDDGWEDCVWYAMRGLALHRLVCRMDYVEDVSVFPVPGEEEGPDNPPSVGSPDQGGGVPTDPTTTVPPAVGTTQPSKKGVSLPNDSDEDTDEDVLTAADSGAMNGLCLPGVRSVTAILVACWVTLF